MRVLVLVAAVCLSVSCAGKPGGSDRPEPIIKFGVIVGKEVVEMETVERDSRASPSFHASISSGGGVAIGLGFLMSPRWSSQTVESPVRYEVRIQDGNFATIYHLSSMFEIDDCVMLTVYPDGDSNPTEMVRSEDGCK